MSCVDAADGLPFFSVGQLENQDKNALTIIQLQAELHQHHESEAFINVNSHKFTIWRTSKHDLIAKDVLLLS